MIDIVVIGIILLVLGYLVPIPPLVLAGWIVFAIGMVFFVLGHLPPRWRE
jgi:hypothetical protein